jgi:hypothetical protein
MATLLGCGHEDGFEFAFGQQARQLARIFLIGLDAVAALLRHQGWRRHDAARAVRRDAVVQAKTEVPRFIDQRDALCAVAVYSFLQRAPLRRQAHLA